MMQRSISQLSTHCSRGSRCFLPAPGLLHGSASRRLVSSTGALRSTPSVPVLTSADEFIARHRSRLPVSMSSTGPGGAASTTTPTVLSFYSGAADAITTDPSLMTIPVDDHGFHRGHAVFDTCNVRRGKAYGLNIHLDRLRVSAKSARIAEISDADSDRLRDIVLQTIAASGKRDGVFVRMWLTSGRGNFGVSPSGCDAGLGPIFYVVCHDDTHDTGDDDNENREIVTGVKAVTSALPVKEPLMANMKTTNYLLNALLQMEAEDKGADMCVQVDSGGNLAESSVSVMLAVRKSDGVLRAPKAGFILPSTTLRRTLEMQDSLVASGAVTAVVREDIPMAQLTDGTTGELIDMGGGFCRPVVSFDGQMVGDGKPGPVFKAMRRMLLDDLENPTQCDDIPLLP